MEEELILDELEIGPPREEIPTQAREELVLEEAVSPQTDGGECQGAEGQEEAPREEPPPERQYCMFRAGSERYCLSVLDVEEIVEWPKVTPVPLAPIFVMGIFNLRGAIVPIVDIAFMEGRPLDTAPKRVVVGLLAAEEGQGFLRIGIAADEVIGTHTTTAPLLVTGLPSEMPHCYGFLRDGEKLSLALDLRRVAEIFPIPMI